MGSKVRQNIVEILYFYKTLHGYEIYKVHKALFPAVSMRLIYYHLKKGTITKEFKIHSITKREGPHSWGDDAENVIYELGSLAKPMIEPRVKLYMENHEKANVSA